MITNEKNTKYFKYLYKLQKSGRCNMFGAASFLVDEMDMERYEAKELLAIWMRDYELIAKELSIDI